MVRRLVFLAAGGVFVAAWVGVLVWIVLRLWFITAPPLPTIDVEGHYPGASADIIAESVAAPIEQLVNGVEGMVGMTSQCRPDGSYFLRVTFARGTDMNVAQVLVQNRVSLALPAIPPLVQREGITVRKAAGSPPILYVLVLSPDDRFDLLYLSNYGTIQVKDELARVAGVAGVTLSGSREATVRLILDPAKLAASAVSVSDVIGALQEQNMVKAPTRPSLPGKPEQIELQIHAAGRLGKVEPIDDVVVHRSGDRLVRLKDIAHFEAGGTPGNGDAFFDGKPVVAIGIMMLPGANPRETAAGVLARLDELRPHLPEGVDLRVAIDSSSELGRPSRSGFLAIDVDLPANASAERTCEVLRRCDQLARETAGIEHALALGGPSYAPNQGMLLIKLKPEADREWIAAHLRSLLKEESRASVRLRSSHPPGRGPLAPYPIDLAILDVGDDPAKLAEFVDALVARLSEGGKVTDVWATGVPGRQKQVVVDVDRAAALARKVNLIDVFRILQLAMGEGFTVPQGDFQDFGIQRIRLAVALDRVQTPDEIRKLTVRNAEGQVVPFADFVSVRETAGGGTIARVDLYRAVEITANPAAGVSLADARKHCESVANDARTELNVGRNFRLRWLPD